MATVQEQEAKARAAELANDDAQAKGRQALVGALVPDLSKIPDKPLTVTGDKALFSSTLAYRALAAAAASAESSFPPLPDDARILITNESDLTAGCTTYLDVSSGIEALEAAAAASLAATLPPTVAPPATLPAGSLGFIAFDPITAVAAAASALPGVLAMLSPQRSLTTSAVSADDLSASALMAGILLKEIAKGKKLTLFHDTFRTVPTAAIYHSLDQLGGTRNELTTNRIALVTAKSQTDQSLSDHSANVATIAAQIKALPADSPDLKAKQDALNSEQLLADESEAESAVLNAQVNLTDSTVSAIDTFVTGVRTIPPGASRSLLATAALFQGLYPTGPEDSVSPNFTHVLLVKAGGGQASQLIDDRPLWFKDTFTTLVESAVTYLIMESNGGSLIAAGAVSGIAQASGTLGSDFSVTPKAATA
ncbi:MAG: hypothetical protein ABI310_07530 [Microbacteriaceae bacterium]